VKSDISLAGAFPGGGNEGSGPVNSESVMTPTIFS